MLEPVAAMTGLIERLRKRISKATEVNTESFCVYYVSAETLDEAADALEALRGYAGHIGETCDFAEPECSCGLTALLAKLGDA